jgi:putative ABC transport system substrate-binding protein
VVDLTGKRLEILKDMVPGLRRVLVTPDPETPSDAARYLADIREAASQLRVTLVEYPISSKVDVERLPEIIKRERVDGLVHLVNRTVNQNWEIVQKTLVEARVPDISYYLPAAERAWVMSAYGVNHREAWRISARLLAKILRGAKPQDIPVESPDVVELHVNLRVAKERRIQIPQTVLIRAGKVFE